MTLHLYFNATYTPTKGKWALLIDGFTEYAHEVECTAPFKTGIIGEGNNMRYSLVITATYITRLPGLTVIS